LLNVFHVIVDVWCNHLSVVNWLQAGVNVIQNDLQAAEYHFKEVHTVHFLYYNNNTVVIMPQ